MHTCNKVERIPILGTYNLLNYDKYQYCGKLKIIGESSKGDAYRRRNHAATRVMFLAQTHDSMETPCIGNINENTSVQNGIKIFEFGEDWCHCENVTRYFFLPPNPFLCGLTRDKSAHGDPPMSRSIGPISLS